MRPYSPVIDVALLATLLSDATAKSAVGDREAALERDPTHVAAHVNAALAQNRLQHWTAAVAHLARARVLSPGDEAVWWILRGNLLLLRRDEDALADFLRFEALAAPSARVPVAALASARRLADPAREARALTAALSQHFVPGESSLVAEALHELYLRYDRLVRAELGAAGEAAHEVPLPLSVCVLPYRRYRAPVPRWTRDELGIAQDAIVCAAFVPALKLSPRCLALWGAILAAVPSAVLLFSPPRDEDCTALLRRARGFGIASSRMCVVPYDGAALHDRHAIADFALTMPYTGGDTTTAALSAGLPMVTRIGLRHAERMTASILRYAGLCELVTDSDDAYVALAVRLATNEAYRNAQRAAVRAALSSTSLSNPAIYTRALETACLRMLSEKKRLPR